VSLDAQTKGLQIKSKKSIAKNTRRGCMIVCFKKFEKIALDPSFISASYFPHL
jgi:hypothetical protein